MARTPIDMTSRLLPKVAFYVLSGWSFHCFAVVTDGKLCSISPQDQELARKITVRIVFPHKNTSEICTGVITGPNEITTAGHCFDGKKADEGFAEVWNSESRMFNKIKLADYRSKNENSPTSGADIAVVKLTKPVPTNFSIPLAISKCDNDDAIIAGYGISKTTEKGNEGSINLRFACYSGPQLFSKISTTQTSYLQRQAPIQLSAKGNRLCGGDSGGPIFCHSNGRLALAGILGQLVSNNATVISTNSEAKCRNLSDLIGTRIPESLSLIQQWREELHPLDELKEIQTTK